MTIEILEIARREYIDAKEFYETEHPGLGSQFEEQIRHSLLRIQQYPQAWPPERKEIRRTSFTNSPTRFSIPFKMIH